VVAVAHVGPDCLLHHRNARSGAASRPRGGPAEFTSYPVRAASLGPMLARRRHLPNQARLTLPHSKKPPPAISNPGPSKSRQDLSCLFLLLMRMNLDLGCAVKGRRAGRHEVRHLKSEIAQRHFLGQLIENKMELLPSTRPKTVRVLNGRISARR
jgi:hypothetical protein